MIKEIKAINGMNRKRHFLILTVVLPLFCWLLLSCSDEEDVLSGSGEAFVRIHVTADGIGDLNATRASANDANAEDGEFMNTLCVFVVDETTGIIEAKIEPDFNEDVFAQTGNLTDYTSDEIKLTLGKKTFYAFSNWNNMQSDEWDNIINKEVGDIINPEELDFAVYDPASKVDLANGKYIPMSGIEENVTIGDDLNSTKLISIGLERLVAKVKINVVGDKDKDVTIDKLTFLGTVEEVSLFPIDIEKSSKKRGFTKYDDDDFGKIELPGTVITAGNKVELASFYVNESYRSILNVDDAKKGFTIMLDMKDRDAADENKFDEYDGTKYIASTKRIDVPRNNIYLIELSLDKYNTTFTVEAKTAPIGFEEVTYSTQAKWHEESGFYLITLRDITSSFTIKPILEKIEVNNNETEKHLVSDVSWKLDDMDTDNGNDDLSWSWLEDQKLFAFTALTAMPGYYYNFTLTADWEDKSGDVTMHHGRTYKMEVVLKEGDFSIDDDNSYKIAPHSWKCGSAFCERLYMEIMRNVGQVKKEDRRI